MKDCGFSTKNISNNMLEESITSFATLKVAQVGSKKSAYVVLFKIDANFAYNFSNTNHK